MLILVNMFKTITYKRIVLFLHNFKNTVVKENAFKLPDENFIVS